MVALYRCGRPADAIEVGRIGRELLAEELGIDPDPPIQALERAILRQDPELAAPERGAIQATVGTPDAARAAGTQSGHAGGPLAGRVEERAVLDRALNAVTSGHGRAVLIGGEPGIGRTRLAEAFGPEVHGASVVWGRCQEPGAPRRASRAIEVPELLHGAADDDHDAGATGRLGVPRRHG